MFTCGEVGEYYAASAARCEAVLSELVSAVVEIGARHARSYIGHQQDGWKPLSGGTIYGFRHPSGRLIIGKSDRGFTGPDFDPLLGDTGVLGSTIDSRTAGLVGEVGSDDQIALYQELGTPGARFPIPPRPFLAKGLLQSVEEIEPLVETAVLDLLVPK